jgi:hypothetical protein
VGIPLTSSAMVIACGYISCTRVLASIKYTIPSMSIFVPKYSL